MAQPTIFSGEYLDMSKKQIKNFRVHNLTTAERIAMGVSLNVTHEGIEVWDVELKQAYWWSGSAWVTWGGGGGDPVAAVVAALKDTDTVKFQWNVSGSGKLQADVQYLQSITAGTGGIRLVNDLATPGNSKYYGTNASGQKGWHDIVSGGGTSYNFQQSVINNSGTVNLSGDVTTPGNLKYYGTNLSGTRGWFALPNSGKTFTFPQSVFELNGTVTLSNDQALPGGNRYYGTNASGVKGWFALPTGGGLVTFQWSIVNNSGTVNLANDLLAPGASYYYGTNLSGLKGWYALPTNDGGVNLLIKEIIFTAGNTGAPAIGATAFQLRDCGGNVVLGKKLVVFREGEFQTQGKHYTYDGDTGNMEVAVELDEEQMIIHAWPPELWETCVLGGGGASFGFPYTIPLTLS
jgi:hypothetical protein